MLQKFNRGGEGRGLPETRVLRFVLQSDLFGLLRHTCVSGERTVLLLAPFLSSEVSCRGCGTLPAGVFVCRLAAYVIPTVAVFPISGIVSVGWLLLADEKRWFVFGLDSIFRVSLRSKVVLPYNSGTHPCKLRCEVFGGVPVPPRGEGTPRERAHKVARLSWPDSRQPAVNRLGLFHARGLPTCLWRRRLFLLLLLFLHLSLGLCGASTVAWWKGGKEGRSGVSSRKSSTTYYKKRSFGMQHVVGDRWVPQTVCV